MRKVLSEFKEFALHGNAMDLAVGIVIGAAFNQVVNSLVNDIINPVIGIFIGHVYFTSFKLVVFHHTLALGSFLNNIINFLIVVFAVFLIVKQINRFRRNEEPKEKHCQFCKMMIPITAERCPHCTSQFA